MKTKRPLGHTRRCANQREKILGLLAQLRAHPEYPAIAEFTHRVLNFAAAESLMGQEAFSKQLQKQLSSALKKLSFRALSFAEAAKELEA